MIYVIGSWILLFLIYYFIRSYIGNRKVDSSANTFQEKPKTQLVLTEEFKEILELLKNTKSNVFITGKAGTGKSSLLQNFIKNSNKKSVVLAPTGVAALNVGGQTIHSFFRFRAAIIKSEDIKIDYVRSNLFQNLQMVIIDEVSMVRSDLMDGVDMALRKNRNRLNEPFGGVQMVFIGDLFQLPPVLTDEDRDYILNKYGGQYFFDAPVFNNFNYQFKELTKVFRQSDEHPEFKRMLNNIRNNNAEFTDMALLNSRHKDNAGMHDNSIFLTTRKNIARNINADKLESLKGEKYEYLGNLTGNLILIKEDSEEKLENKLPAPYKLILKKDAQIMMLKNDTGKRWVNGSIGRVEKLDQREIIVNISGNKYKIEKESWNEVEYVLNPQTKEIEEKTVAGFTQYPIQLSYAMTIHKSQGKTFDKITIDVGTGAFAHGQIYVALSRCRTLEGIVLHNAINDNDIIVDPRVIEFYKTRARPETTVRVARKTDKIDVHKTLLLAIKNGTDVKIIYENYNGESSERLLSNIKISKDFNSYGYNDQHITAYCHFRKEDRSFKIERIRDIEIIDSATKGKTTKLF